MSTDENDIVLDPFSGTGTTAIAAKRLGRHFIGLELDSIYFEASRNKLAQETANSKIGECWVSYFLDGIVTLRDKDWSEISQYYFIPQQIEQIDSVKIALQKSAKSCLCPPQTAKTNSGFSLPY